MRTRILLTHCKMQLLEIIRSPSFISPVFICPGVFFLYFGEPSAETLVHAQQMTVSYVLYAILMVALFHFGGDVAEHRRQSWQPYLRTLPYIEWMQFGGRLLAGLVVAVVAVIPIIILALALTPFTVPAGQLIPLAVAALLGSIPIALLAFTLGYWLPPKSTLPIGHLIFLSLTYAGALWTLPKDLPSWLRAVSPFTPTRLWAEVSWAAAMDHSWLTLDWLGLLGYSILFATPAILGIHRYEEERYR